MTSKTSTLVFLSYSRKDQEVMHHIASFLRRREISVWIDTDYLEPGTRIWEEEIEKAIQTSMSLVVICSPDSKNSEWVRREITYAEQHRKHIIPVLVRGDNAVSITISLINHQFLDLRSQMETGLNQLANVLINLPKKDKPGKVNGDSPSPDDKWDSFHWEQHARISVDLEEERKKSIQQIRKKAISQLQGFLRSLPSTPTLPIMTFLEIYSDETIDDEGKLKVILFEYRKRFVEAIEFMKARGESVPKNIETSIYLIDQLLALQHWVGK